MLAGHTWSHDPTDNPWVQSWGAPTGVNLEWVWMGAEQMPIVFASDNSPDMMFGVAGGHKNLIAGMLQNGVVADLRPHLGKGYTPNLDRIFAEKPEGAGLHAQPAGPDAGAGAVPLSGVQLPGTELHDQPALGSMPWAWKRRPPPASCATC